MAKKPLTKKQEQRLKRNWKRKLDKSIRDSILRSTDQRDVDVADKDTEISLLGGRSIVKCWPQTIWSPHYYTHNRSSVGTGQVDDNGRQFNSHGKINEVVVHDGYWDMVQQIVREYPFKRAQHRFILECRANGLTEEEISARLAVSRKKSLTASGVGKVIRKIIAEWKRNIYPGSQYEMDALGDYLSYSEDDHYFRIEPNHLEVQSERYRNIMRIHQMLDNAGLGDRIGLNAKGFIEQSLAEGEDPKYVLLYSIRHLDEK
ncbi:MAG: hypothetical protein AB7G93_10035 [Bdellovibrionales bacterium]